MLLGFKTKSKVTVFTWMFCVMFVMFVFFQDETVTVFTWIFCVMFVFFQDETVTDVTWI